jgi:hypothetical protein
MHGNIVNVPTNFNLMQNILSRMPYDDSSIVVFKKRKWNVNQCICQATFVIVMKA